MSDRLQRFGYMEAAIRPGTILTPDKTEHIRGHEFHYTKRIDDSDFACVYDVTKQRQKSVATWQEGYSKKNTVAGYPHFHFYSNPTIARNFLLAAESRREAF